MTEIRIRHIDEPDGATLGDVPFGDIDNVIPQLQRWGVNLAGDGTVDNSRLSGTFDYDPATGKAFFEVLIEGEE